MKRIILVIYPFLIALYPVIELRNYNIIYVDFASIFRTLIIAEAITIFVWLLFRAFTGNWKKASALTGITTILFFSYGHLYIQLRAIFGDEIGHKYLGVTYGLIFLFAGWTVIKNSTAVELLNNFLATIAVVLLTISITQSLSYEYKSYSTLQTILSQDNKPPNIEVTSHPDIYVIVLDAHGREDVLRDHFGYDSSSFIQELSDMGFYVARCSQSNYASTNLSLTSLFNADYISPPRRDSAKLPPVKESLAIRSLKSLGYTVITFENRVVGHFDLGEDVRLSRNQLVFGEMDLFGGLNEFEKTMLTTSAMKLFIDTQIIPELNENAIAKSEDYEHYLQTLFILSKLPEISGLTSPKLVFVHIMVPHSPFVFTPDGKFRYPEENNKNGYRANAEFIDKNILRAIHSILQKSKQPPVIILMGDHGPPTGKSVTPQMRMSNLDAYYVNEKAKASLYNSITPVNSFRVIFNHYFGGNYPLLKDISYYAYKLKQLNDAQIIENTCVTRTQAH